MTKLELVELIALAIVAIGLGIYFLVKAIKNGWITKITKTMNEAIKYAELNFTDGDKKKKKLEYVLSKVEEECDELGIPFTLIRNLVTKIVKRIISDYNVIKK